MQPLFELLLGNLAIVTAEAGQAVVALLYHMPHLDLIDALGLAILMLRRQLLVAPQHLHQEVLALVRTQLPILVVVELGPDLLDYSVQYLSLICMLCQPFYDVGDFHAPLVGLLGEHAKDDLRHVSRIHILVLLLVLLRLLLVLRQLTDDSLEHLDVAIELFERRLVVSFRLLLTQQLASEVDHMVQVLKTHVSCITLLL